LSELPLYNRYGKAVYRLCQAVLYDYHGQPRGFVVGQAIYDLRGQHRGFWRRQVVWDRMCRVVGYAHDAQLADLALPPVEIPPLPYANQPAPQVPAGVVEKDCPTCVPAWSMMRLENLLPT